MNQELLKEFTLVKPSIPSCMKTPTITTSWVKLKKDFPIYLQFYNH